MRIGLCPPGEIWPKCRLAPVGMSSSWAEACLRITPSPLPCIPLDPKMTKKYKEKLSLRKLCYIVWNSDKIVPESKFNTRNSYHLVFLPFNLFFFGGGRMLHQHIGRFQKRPHPHPPTTKLNKQPTRARHKIHGYVFVSKVKLLT